MASRPVNDTVTTHYAILGVSRGASLADIKRAYRIKAKAAHPDAGGNVAAMSRVNAAYKILCDPIARRDYDADQAAAVPHAQSSASPTTHQPPRPQPQRTREQSPYTNIRSDQVNRDRTVWARRSAWEMLRFTAPLALCGAIIRLFSATYFTSPATLLIVGLITFLPVYLFTLGLIFLTDPPLRLVFADLVRRYPTAKHDRKSALIIVLAFFPLAAIWALWR